jgi:Na+-translocating ferredoxin:NAD+ oxidoreductase subunit E
MENKSNLFEFKKGLIAQNPVLVLLLGLCPVLAVTTSFINAFTMGMAVIFVLTSSTLVVSAIKRVVPSQVRIATFTIIIATFVTIADIFLKANFPSLSKSLGPYVPLIVVNCIILGRCEAFASKNSIFKTLLDSLGMGLGFTSALVVLGSMREILGAGKILNINILGTGYEPMLIMILPAGAFIGLGIMVGLMNTIKKRR